MEGGSAVIGTSAAQFLVIIAAAPYAGSGVGGVADKPDIVIGGCCSALSRTGHIGKGGAGAGGIDIHAGAGKFSVALHGCGHGIREQKGGGIF